MTKPNDFMLYTELDGHLVSNFNLREFWNPEGWSVVHPSILYALECTRRDLNLQSYDGIVELIITDCTRTTEQLQTLAARLGWTDQGGVVARQSYHLLQFGGIAVDFKARMRRSKAPIPPWQVGKIAARYFHYVNAEYNDGHIHGDLRKLVTR